MRVRVRPSPSLRVCAFVRVLLCLYHSVVELPLELLRHPRLHLGKRNGTEVRGRVGYHTRDGSFDSNRLIKESSTIISG
jgi:hypothetical protein